MSFDLMIFIIVISSITSTITSAFLSKYFKPDNKNYVVNDTKTNNDNEKSTTELAGVKSKLGIIKPLPSANLDGGLKNVSFIIYYNKKFAMCKFTEQDIESAINRATLKKLKVPYILNKNITIVDKGSEFFKK